MQGTNDKFRNIVYSECQSKISIERSSETVYDVIAVSSCVFSHYVMQLIQFQLIFMRFLQ
jgi:hypothetical protein